MMIENILV